jgi:hypothetical protein
MEKENERTKPGGQVMGKPLYVLLNRRFQHFDGISSNNAQRLQTYM